MADAIEYALRDRHCDVSVLYCLEACKLIAMLNSKVR